MSATAQCDYCHLPVARATLRRQARATTGRLYCCYGCRFAAQVTQARGEAGQATWMLTRLGISVFLSMGVMVFSLALYSQEIYDIDLARATPFAVSLTGLMRYLSLVLATPVFILLGLPILANAMDQIRGGSTSTDALVVLGVGSALLYSYYSTITDSGAIYYETACMILVLITGGRYLEATGKLKASEQVRALETLLPDEVSVRRGDTTLTVKTADVRVNDLLLVVAGQRVAADGRIETGRAHFDEQIVTGESTPVVKGAGDAVHAGSIALDGTLTVRTIAVGADSALGRLITLLDQAKRSKGRYERLADRVATIFVPVTIALACAAAVLGYRQHQMDQAIMSSLAVLLVSCPCALGIATPLAIWIALGRAAGVGVLFRNSETIEKCSRVRALGFDKTGTLTTGEPTVASLVTDVGDDSCERRGISLAAGLAATSTHALARSVSAYARDRGIARETVTDVKTIPGRGVVGMVAGTPVYLGSATMMREASLEIPPTLAQALQHADSAEHSMTCLAHDRTVLAVFFFTETLRGEAAEVLSTLRRNGYGVRILTGDHARRGEVISRELNAETVAELSPAQKLVQIERLRREAGAVAMVGDGLNDAPALAAADVGIAMRCGADLTREAADVCLLGDDLNAIPIVLALSRRTMRTVKLNLLWAFLYNVLLIPLAMCGRLNPILAASAMVISSLFVVTNSLRLGRDAPRTHACRQASR